MAVVALVPEVEVIPVLFDGLLHDNLKAQSLPEPPHGSRELKDSKPIRRFHSFLTVERIID